MKHKMLGEKLSPILEEIEQTLWEFEAREVGRPEFTMGGFRAAIKIFASVLMERAWLNMQDKTLEEKKKLASGCGDDIRELIKKYTSIDSKQLYFH